MDKLDGQTLEARLARIGAAAKLRNPTGFVDVQKRRQGGGVEKEHDEDFSALSVDDGKRTEWIFCPPSAALERALARGNAEAAQQLRREAQSALQREALDGSLLVSRARTLFREGASARRLFGEEQDVLAQVLLRCSERTALFLCVAAGGPCMAESIKRSAGAQRALAACGDALKREVSILVNPISEQEDPAENKRLAAEIERGRDAAALLETLGKIGGTLPDVATWDVAKLASRCDRLEKERDENKRSSERVVDLAQQRVLLLESELLLQNNKKKQQHKGGVEEEEEKEDNAPASSLDTSGSLSEEERVVLSIRRERLVGCESELARAPSAVREGARALQSSLAAAAQRLAKDLYDSPTTHFIEELLQNADDAEYDSEQPTLELGLIVGEPSIFFAASNQRPLAERNVRALCDLNRSSKEHSDTTGEKGIGFKACFAVSSRVAVLSGGYSLCFDAREKQGDGALGLVTPQWLGDTDVFAGGNEQAHLLLMDRHLKGCTVVALRLDDANTTQLIEEALSGPKLLTDELLIFARRLRVFKTTIGSTTTTMEKRFVTETASCYHRTEVEVVSSSKIAEKYILWRKNGSFSMCFPMGINRRPGYAHALLAVDMMPRAFGFSVNAAFDVTASRAALRVASPLNIELRRGLRDLLVSALREDEQLRARALDFLWLSDDDDNEKAADGFWLSLRDEILSMGLLGDLKCVPSSVEGELLRLDCCLRRPSSPAICALLDLVPHFAITQEDKVLTLSPRAPKAAQPVTARHLVDWLEKEHCSLDPEVLYAALLEVEPEDWPRLRAINDLVPLRFLATQLASKMPMAFSTRDGRIRVDDDTMHYSELEGVCLAVGFEGAEGLASTRFLEAHGVLKSTSLKDLCDRAIADEALSLANQDEDVELCVRRLSLLRLGFERGVVAFGERCLRWVDASGTRMRPAASLVSPLYFGNSARLPFELSKIIGEMAGSLQEEEEEEQQNLAMLPSNANIEWEAFFDAIGMARSLNGDKGLNLRADLLAAAGASLSEANFLKNCSKPALAYLKNRLDDPEELAQVRALPVVGVGTVRRFDECFLRHAFYPLCGQQLNYLFNGGYPELEAQPEQLELVSKLVLGARTDWTGCAFAIRALVANKKQGIESVFGALASVYKGVDDLAGLVAGDAHLVAVDDGDTTKLVCLADCVWEDDVELCSLAGTHMLSVRYARYEMRQMWLGAGLEPRLGRLQDHLAVLVALSTDRPAAAKLRPGRKWRLVSEAMRRVARGSRHQGEAAEAEVHNAFRSQRLILLPRLRGDDDEDDEDEGVLQLIALGCGEAFWSVAPGLAHTTAPLFALKKHYPLLKAFFLETLGVKREFTAEDYRKHVESVTTATSVHASSSTQMGFSPADLATSTQEEEEANGDEVDPTPELAVAAVESTHFGSAAASANVLSLESWPAEWAGTGLTEFGQTLMDLATLFGVPPRAVGLSAHVGCAKHRDGALIFSLPRYRQRGNDAAFWLSEFAHALAHFSSPSHDALHGATAQSLIALVAPHVHGIFPVDDQYDAHHTHYLHEQQPPLVLLEHPPMVLMHPPPPPPTMVLLHAPPPPPPPPAQYQIYHNRQPQHPHGGGRGGGRGRGGRNPWARQPRPRTSFSDDINDTYPTQYHPPR